MAEQQPKVLRERRGVLRREELFGAPHPTKRAGIAAGLFGLLAVLDIAVPALSDTTPMPGNALLALGLMLGMGFAELIDRTLYRLAIALRFVGIGLAVFGVVVQLL